MNKVRFRKQTSQCILLVLLAFSTPLTGQSATVTSTADDGPGSLREAIQSAGSGETIDFDLSLPATISLTSGPLSINNNLTISGPGASSLTIDATDNNARGRVFTIGDAVSVSISGLTITGGQGRSRQRRWRDLQRWDTVAKRLRHLEQLGC